MSNTAIIIPTRLGARRLPNKPLIEIKGVPMIIHVMNQAKQSEVGEVFVATPDVEIIDIVEKNGGKAILTNKNHKTGSDRVYEAYTKDLKEIGLDFIINLQGDMPSISPNAISKLNQFMRNNNCDIGTLAAFCKNEKEIADANVVKVRVDEYLHKDNFLNAKDFFRVQKDLKNEKIYHHIGIYAFTKDALTKYVRLSRSKLEIERNLEQMRAIENNLVIKVGLSDSMPLGVDTESDLKKIIKEMN